MLSIPTKCLDGAPNLFCTSSGDIFQETPKGNSARTKLGFEETE